jgi:hypothetical protein
MKIMVLESDPEEQSIISEMLEHSSECDCDVQYETTVTRAINSLGLAHVDFALVDADYQSCICSWKELTSFLNSVNIGYSVFSSNGKVGFKDGLQIHSINDLPTLIEKKSHIII